MQLKGAAAKKAKTAKSKAADSLAEQLDPLCDPELSSMPEPPTSPVMASPTARTAKVVVASNKRGLTVLKREVHVIDEIFPNVPSPSKKARLAPEPVIFESSPANQAMTETAQIGSGTKRGRPPKNRILAESVSVETSRVENGSGGKRGRPPKNRVLPEPVPVEPAHNGSVGKRGRPPKNPVFVEAALNETGAKRGRPPKIRDEGSPLRVEMKSPTKIVIKSPSKISSDNGASPKNSSPKKRKNKASAACSMVTIHQQDLIEVIKLEPESDTESDPEIQISSILRDKTNPNGLSDDVQLVTEVQMVSVEYEPVDAPQNGGDVVGQQQGESFLPDNVDDDKANHECKICAKIFPRKDSLKIHIQNVHSEEVRLFSCNNCNKSFSTPTALKSHIEKVSICNDCNGLKICGPYNYQKHRNQVHLKLEFGCGFCPEQFAHKRDLRRHEATHKTDLISKVFSCVVCRKLFGNPLSAGACERIHTKLYECKICRLSCRSPAELRRHEDTHNNVRNFKCAYCPKLLKSEASLRLHIKDIHNKPVDKTIKCLTKSCEKMFYTDKQRRSHHRSTHADKIYSCFNCPAKFSSEALLTRHFNLKHGSNPDFNSPRERVGCTVCNKVLLSKYYLKVHMMKHTDLKPFKCEECDKSFSRKWVLANHKMTVHMGEESRKFQCTSCPSSFVNLGQLNFHSKYSHTTELNGVSSLKCTIKGCDHVAKTKTQLEAHLKSLKHCDVKTFKCPQCSMTFNRKWTMEEHILRRHEDVRRQMTYKCLLCGRGFYFHKSYLRHQSVKHTQACEFCDLSFATTRYHMDHRRAVHGIMEALDNDVKWPPCQICGNIFGALKALKKHIAKEHSDQPYSVEDPGRVGTFEENNDDPEITLNFGTNKRSKREVKTKSRKRSGKKSSSVIRELKQEEF